MRNKHKEDLARQNRDTQKRRQRRKNRGEFYAQKKREEAAALADTETLVLEIEVKIPKASVNYARHEAYGLEGDEEHDAIMQTCVNKINNKPLRDFEITGWGFKEKSND